MSYSFSECSRNLLVRLEYLLDLKRMSRCIEREMVDVLIELRRLSKPLNLKFTEVMIDAMLETVKLPRQARITILLRLSKSLQTFYDEYLSGQLVTSYDESSGYICSARFSLPFEPTCSNKKAENKLEQEELGKLVDELVFFIAQSIENETIRTISAVGVSITKKGLQLELTAASSAANTDSDVGLIKKFMEDLGLNDDDCYLSVDKDLIHLSTCSQKEVTMLTTLPPESEQLREESGPDLQMACVENRFGKEIKSTCGTGTVGLLVLLNHPPILLDKLKRQWSKSAPPMLAVITAAHVVPRCGKFPLTDLLSMQYCLARDLATNFVRTKNANHSFSDIDLLVLDAAPTSFRAEDYNCINETFYCSIGVDGPMQLNGNITTVLTTPVTGIASFPGLTQGDKVFFIGKYNKVYGTFDKMVVRHTVGNVPHYVMMCNIRCRSGDSGGLLFIRSKFSDKQFTGIGILSRFETILGQDYGLRAEFAMISDLNCDLFALPNDGDLQSMKSILDTIALASVLSHLSKLMGENSLQDGKGQLDQKQMDIKTKIIW